MNLQELFTAMRQSTVVEELVIGAGLIIVGLVSYVLVKKYVLRALDYLFAQTRHNWERVLYQKGIFRQLPQVVPAIVLFQGSKLLPVGGEMVRRLVVVWFYFIIMGFVDRLLSGILLIYNTHPISNKRPIKGYVQITKLILYITVGILSVAILFDQSPLFFLSGLGALTAVLMLVFRDTILSFIASLQLIANDLVRVGDWLEMPKYDADGSVAEIALHTVQVRNWDNTLTTIPTYKLMEESFKNWRGMTDSGGRRIKRSILIDQTSVKFCNEEMIERYLKIQLLHDYIERKQRELAAYNSAHSIDTTVMVNGRRMTNLGTFRAYLEAYMRSHPKIHQGMMLLVRQMQPTPKGIPIEIYGFTTDTAWVDHERIQSDMLDHILATIPEFDLRIAQEPLGHDWQEAIRNLKAEEADPHDTL